MSLVFGIIIALGFVFGQMYGEPSILYVAVIFSIGLQLVSFWYSDKIALKVSGAKPADPIQYRDLHNVVENLSITAGLPKPKVYIIDDLAPNAFATGRNKEKAAVAATTGLLSLLDHTELEGVISHELSHIGNRDILVSTIAVVLVGAVSLLADMFLRSMLWGGHDRDSRAGAIIMLVGVALAILAPIFATLLQFAISRKREYLADATGAMLTRYPEGLARALLKIGAYNQPLKRANHATAHLYIANPFGKTNGAVKFLSGLMSTHPPVEKRVHILRNMGM